MNATPDERGAFLLNAQRDWVEKYFTGDVDEFICVYGAVDTGKSELFSYLARHGSQDNGKDSPHYAYLDLCGPADISTTLQLWTEIARAFKVDIELTDDDVQPHRLRDTADSIISLASEFGNPILILDHWDKCRGDRIKRVDLNAIVGLTNVLIYRRANRYEGYVPCQVVMVTAFPDIEYLLSWAHRLKNEAPGLERLSGDLSRVALHIQFPFLDKVQSRKLIKPAYSGDEATSVINDCLGWLALLKAAVDSATSERVYGDAQRHEVTRVARRCLEDPVLHELRANTPGVDDGVLLRQLFADVRTGKRLPDRDHLPIDHLNKIAPAVLRICPQPSFLVIDSENVFAAVVKNRIPPMKAKAFRQRIVSVVKQIADDHDVAEDRIVVACRSESELRRAFGEVPSNWIKDHSRLSPEMRERKRENGAKDNSDDTALCTAVGTYGGQFPNARIFILGGDIDYWAQLDHKLHPDVLITQLAPGKVAKELKREHSDRWIVETHVLDKRMPTSLAEPDDTIDLRDTISLDRRKEGRGT